MKDYLTELVRDSSTPLQARNTTREYLQARILEALQRAGAMIPLAFHGGTALRFLFATARYSEDLDFALEHRRELYDFRGYLRAIQSELGGEGYVVTVKQSWRGVLADRLQALDWSRVADDVRPLLEPSANVQMLTLENLERVLAR